MFHSRLVRNMRYELLGEQSEVLWGIGARRKSQGRLNLMWTGEQTIGPFAWIRGAVSRTQPSLKLPFAIVLSSSSGMDRLQYSSHRVAR